MKSKKPLIFTLIALVVIFGGIFAWYGLRQHFINQFFAHFGQEPQVISAHAAKKQDWQPYLYAVGDLNSISGADISPEVPGRVTAIYFKSGAPVKTGDPLLQLEDSSEKAQLKNIGAQLQLAQINLTRSQNLFAKKVTSKAALDEASSQVKQLEARFDDLNSQLSKKLLRAPFDGKIGIKQINVGQVVSAGQVVVSLQVNHALHADFSLPQQNIAEVAVKQKVLVSTDAYLDKKFEGFVNAVDSKVDETTRTIAVQATVDNSDGKLYPGMYVTIQLLLPVVPNMVTVPQTAVTYTLYGDSAFVVTLNGKKDAQGHDLGTVKRVFVRTGDKQENTVVILDGIQANDLVVDAGQSKLDDGSSVAINNSTTL